MLWNLLTAGIFGTDYYIKKKINTSEKKDLKEKCLGGRLIVRNCHNHGMMLGILKNKDKEFLRDLASMVLGGAIWEYIRTSGEKGTRQKNRRQSPEARAHAFHFARGAMIHCPEKKAGEKCHVKHIGMKRQQKECRI